MTLNPKSKPAPMLVADRIDAGSEPSTGAVPAFIVGALQGQKMPRQRAA